MNKLTKIYDSDRGLCRVAASDPVEPNTLNGKWPTGTWFQTRLATVLVRRANEIKKEEVSYGN